MWRRVICAIKGHSRIDMWCPKNPEVMRRKSFCPICDKRRVA